MATPCVVLQASPPEMTGTSVPATPVAQSAVDQGAAETT